MSRILLTGFMGSGKSVTGALLANSLSLEFIDLDERISDLARSSVEQIFAEQGEYVFRQLESKALKSLPDNIVCALGGGALVDSENLVWTLNKSWLIYLRAGEGELLSRLQKDHTIRPLLLDDNSEPLCSNKMGRKIHSLLKEREPIYNQAHLTINVDGIPPEEVVKLCLKGYNSRNERR